MVAGVSSGGGSGARPAARAARRNALPASCPPDNANLGHLPAGIASSSPSDPSGGASPHAARPPISRAGSIARGGTLTKSAPYSRPTLVSLHSADVGLSQLAQSLGRPQSTTTLVIGRPSGRSRSTLPSSAIRYENQCSGRSLGRPTISAKGSNCATSNGTPARIRAR